MHSASLKATTDSLEVRQRDNSWRYNSIDCFDFSEPLEESEMRDQFDKDKMAWLSLQYLDHTKGRYPSIQVIFDGIVKEAARLALEEASKLPEREQQKAAINVKEAWGRLVLASPLFAEDPIELSRPLSRFELEDSDSCVTSLLLTLLSLDSFLPRALQLANGDRDVSKINSLGPLSLALSHITRSQYWRRQFDFDKKVLKTVYRLLPLSADCTIEHLEEMRGKWIPISGFTSFSADMPKGDRTADSVLVIMFVCSQFHFFNMDEERYSAYAKSESEFLFRPSTPVKIEEVHRATGSMYGAELVLTRKHPE